MKNRVTMAIAASIFTLTNVHAFDEGKVKVNGNMSLEYKKLPKSVDTLHDAFSEGIFYGRLRSNFFLWDWAEETAKNKDNKANGVGGSIVYKTAPFVGLSATAGLYTSQNLSFWREDRADIGFVKAGKDTFSRQDVADDGTYGMSVLGQAYLQYDLAKTSLKAGRQMIETVFTKSNDTKMIPNTFDALVLESKDIPQTKLQAAYIISQKLRDHVHGHDVVAFDGSDKWSQNDDSAINKSLTADLVGIDNKLIVVEANNNSVKNLKLKAAYAMVPDVVSNIALEAHYKIPLGQFSIAPGIRYMYQMDGLNADANTKNITANGVANLKGKGDGYSDRYSLDSNLLAARIDMATGAMKFRLGYSQVDDKADIVAPWRGFPTGGFTRAMAQYNWYANTKTYMARFDYDLSKANLVDDMKFLVRYAIQDFDDAKPGVQADSNIIHMDIMKKFTEGLEGKIRIGVIDGATDIKDMNGNIKADPSYNEYRVELNYLF